VLMNLRQTLRNTIRFSYKKQGFLEVFVFYEYNKK